MTEKDLAEIEARANAATLGPWRKLPLTGKYYGTDVQSPTGGGITVWRFGNEFTGASPEELENWDSEEPFDYCDSHYQTISDAADATFIAHARQDIPALVAEVRRQNAHIRRLEMLLEPERKWHPPFP